MATSFWALTAWGADAPPAQPPGLITTILNMLVPVFGTIAVWIVHRVVSALESKIGIQVDQANYDKLMDIVDHGIHFAAESAGKKIDTRIAGAYKLMMATDFVNDNITKWGLDKVAGDKLQQLIEARLSMDKLGAKSKQDLPVPEKVSPF